MYFLCMWIYLCICMCIYMCLSVYISACVNVCAIVYWYMCLCIRVCTYMCVYLCICRCMCICVCICICEYVNNCNLIPNIYIYVYILLNLSNEADLPPGKEAPPNLISIRMVDRVRPSPRCTNIAVLRIWDIASIVHTHETLKDM